ncbi:uncharacterized protein LY79DRAFT_568126 [Colletotrichum navitas]|uniref:Uncharacterized protein n=1 Tax=Colletotrichum navitas TaxID=681940 RepID=A0AAD8UZW9_9PEZI|nr:uncharacterized protein LY79DRAFT_568126 [Colletotrichum navitas]KAK1573658.1 hypothetical protein LY79DRAFT_568126 [Colletotrichum navitas]
MTLRGVLTSGLLTDLIVYIHFISWRCFFPLTRVSQLPHSPTCQPESCASTLTTHGLSGAASPTAPTPSTLGTSRPCSTPRSATSITGTCPVSSCPATPIRIGTPGALNGTCTSPSGTGWTRSRRSSSSCSPRTAPGSRRTISAGRHVSTGETRKERPA